MLCILVYIGMQDRRIVVAKFRERVQANSCGASKRSALIDENLADNPPRRPVQFIKKAQKLEVRMLFLKDLA